MCVDKSLSCRPQQYPPLQKTQGWGTLSVGAASEIQPSGGPSLSQRVMDVKERRTRIDANGRVVIPASFRRALGVKPGDTVVLRLRNDELLVTTLRQRLAKAQRSVRRHVAPTVSLVNELIAERRAAAERENSPR